jgi:O-methyltransferase
VRRRIRGILRRFILRRGPESLYPTPVSALGPERLYAYFDAIWQRRDVEGAVVEVGCWLGGTAALARQLLRNTGIEKRYVCVDTFTGFLPEQLAAEQGLTGEGRPSFTGASIDMVHQLLRHWGCEDIELVAGDIVTLDDDVLPPIIAVALVDVDLELPVYEALRRIWPRLAPGGVILVDDCPNDPASEQAYRFRFLGAKRAYARFMGETGRAPAYRLGMGIVQRP